MQIDLMAIPEVFDRVHVGLAGLSLFLLMLCLMLMVVGMAASRRAARAERALAQAMTASRNPAAVSKPVKPVQQAPLLQSSLPDSALQLLGLLQQEARFVDFVQEDIAGHADADIGAAARIIHEGSRKVIRQYFDLQPVRPETEGSRLTLPKGYDAAAVRITGNIAGEPPFSGTLVHRGWRVSDTRLPKVVESHDVTIISPAEVEL